MFRLADTACSLNVLDGVVVGIYRRLVQFVVLFHLGQIILLCHQLALGVLLPFHHLQKRLVVRGIVHLLVAAQNGNSIILAIFGGKIRNLDGNARRGSCIPASGQAQKVARSVPLLQLGAGRCQVEHVAGEDVLFHLVFRQIHIHFVGCNGGDLNHGQEHSRCQNGADASFQPTSSFSCHLTSLLSPFISPFIKNTAAV